jgi:hypothetical protein
VGFIQDGVAAAVDLALHRIARNDDHGAHVQKPDVDLKQQAEFLAEQVQGQDEERINERFRKCLEYHGFRFLAVHQLPPVQSMAGRGVRTEGEWRHRNPKVRLAFTARDLASGWRGAEDLDKYLKDQLLAAAVTAGRVPKEVLRQTRSRKT